MAFHLNKGYAYREAKNKINAFVRSGSVICLKATACPPWSPPHDDVDVCNTPDGHGECDDVE